MIISGKWTTADPFIPADFSASCVGITSKLLLTLTTIQWVISLFWIRVSLKPKTETKRLKLGLSPELRLTISPQLTSLLRADSITSSLTSSLISPYFFVFYELAKMWSDFRSSNFNLYSLTTYLVHAKSTAELISFGFNDRSVRSFYWANRSAQTKNDFIFWLLSGVSQNLGLSESLSERIIQNVK